MPRFFRSRSAGLASLRGLALLVFASLPPNAHAQSKLIEWGWDEPTAQFVHDNVATMEQRAFDGVSILIRYGTDTTSTYLGYGHVFRATPLDWNDPILQQDIGTLRSTAFQKLTDNFTDVYMNASANGPFIDWFDDWSPYLNNFGVLAEVLRQAGLKGFILDTEAYGSSNAFNYSWQKYAASYTADQYKAQARLRGQQVMDAINAHYPGLTILLTYGYGHLAWEQRNGGTIVYYELLPAFLDGLLSRMAAPARLVDGYEDAYPYRTGSQFADGYSDIKVGGRAFSAVPAAYDTFYKAGFGNWMSYKSYYNDCTQRFSWNLTNTSCNWFAPSDLRQAICSALQTSESYAWTWAGVDPYPNWWTGANLSTDYITAVADAKALYQTGQSCTATPSSSSTTTTTTTTSTTTTTKKGRGKSH